MSPAVMIEAERLTKHFGSFVAVSDVTFTVPAGEVVAFVGPNAAGKSTTMRMLTGFLSPTAGVARVAGIDVAKDRIGAAEKIGYLPENGPLYLDMTPDGMLSFFGRARGLAGSLLAERKADVIQSCGLEDVARKRISKLSRGYCQRVSLASALLHRPDVLILDEPTNGLDPNQAREARKMLRKIGRKRTILLSTHVMQEVQAIASRVIMIANGRLVFDGSLEELEEQGKDRSLESAFHRLTSPRERSSPPEVRRASPGE